MLIERNTHVFTITRKITKITTMTTMTVTWMMKTIRIVTMARKTKKMIWTLSDEDHNFTLNKNKNRFPEKFLAC